MCPALTGLMGAKSTGTAPGRTTVVRLQAHACNTTISRHERCFRGSDLKRIHKLLAPVPLLTFLCGGALSRQSIQIEPLPPVSTLEKPSVWTTPVSNIYGRCRNSVVQVLGLAKREASYFTVDPSALGGSTVVVIAPGGRRHLNLEKAISDFNGVACLREQAATYLMVWSACNGSACSDGYTFTIVDIDRFRVIAENGKPCSAACAARLTGSSLPIEVAGTSAGL